VTFGHSQCNIAGIHAGGKKKKKKIDDDFNHVCPLSGGATVDNSLNEAPVPDLEQQVNAFLSDLSAQSAGAGPSNGKSLIAVWVGINSITKVSYLILPHIVPKKCPLPRVKI
jgi:hypothetical protein